MTRGERLADRLRMLGFITSDQVAEVASIANDLIDDWMDDDRRRIAVMVGNQPWENALVFERLINGELDGDS